MATHSMVVARVQAWAARNCKSAALGSTTASATAGRWTRRLRSSELTVFFNDTVGFANDYFTTRHSCIMYRCIIENIYQPNDESSSNRVKEDADQIDFRQCSYPETIGITE